MKAVNHFRPTPQSIAAALLVGAASWSALGDTAPLRVETVNETQTSWIPRVITNVIEVRIPTNIFINIYRTNLVETVRSNVINVYQTNWTDRDLTRTNFVTRYRTNFHTLHLTNWESVLVMKTNRVSQRVPNVVEIDLPASPADAVKTPAPSQASIGAETSGTAGGLTLETATTGKIAVNDLVEVQFKLKSADGATPRLASCEWRVERTDGSVLLFGQEPEFKREVPMGTYRIEAKTRAAASSPFVRVRGVVEVTDREVIQQRSPLGVSAR